LRFTSPVRPDYCGGEMMAVASLIPEQLKKIGIEMKVKPTERSLWTSRILASDFDIAFFEFEMGCSGKPSAISISVPYPISQYTFWGTKWGLWYQTNGKSGEEPPPEVKQLQKIYKEIMLEPSKEKRTALVREASEIHSKNLFIVGITIEPTLGAEETYAVCKNYFKNIYLNGECVNDASLSSCGWSCQYYIDK